MLDVLTKNFICDDEKRLEALRLATGGRFSHTDPAPLVLAEVIKRAEGYYTFLSGDSKPEKATVTTPTTAKKPRRTR